MLVVALESELNGMDSVLRTARLVGIHLDARSILRKLDDVNNSPLGPFVLFEVGRFAPS